METDYWAHAYYDDPRADEVEDEDFDLDEIIRQMEDGQLEVDDWEEIK